MRVDGPSLWCDSGHSPGYLGDEALIALGLFTAACAVVCAVVALPATGAVAAGSGAKGRIAYGSELTHNWRSRHLDGTGNRPLLYDARDVSFSADGRRLAYVRVRSDGLRVGVAVAGGNGREPIWVIRPHDQRIPDLDDVYGVALSPDGTRIATALLERKLIGEPGEKEEVNIYVVGADGSNLRLLARDAVSPAWSADGSRIAYIDRATKAVETIAPDGTGRRRLLPPNAAVDRKVKSDLDFSRDGRTLMFLQHSGRPQISRIVVADLATGAVRRLPARVTGVVNYAVWCANGRRIAFTVAPELFHPSIRVYTIRPDGTGKRLAFAIGPGWSDIDGLAWQPPRRPRTDAVTVG